MSQNPSPPSQMSLDDPSDREGSSVWACIPRILPYLLPYWPLAAGTVVLVVAAAGVGLLAPWPLKVIIDTVLEERALPEVLVPVMGNLDRETLLVLAVLGGLAITLIQNAVTVLHDYVTTKLDQRMVLDFRSDLFQHAQRLSLGFHDRARTGQLMYRINNQATTLGKVTMTFPPLAESIITLVGMFWIAYHIDPELALLSLTVVPFLYYSVGYYTRHIEERLREVKGMEGRSLAIVHEAMSMLRVIVAFGREDHEYRRFRDQGETAVDARVRLTVRQTLFSLVVNTTTAIGTALVLGFGAWHVMEGQLTVGELLVVLSYIGAIYAPLESISGTVGSLQEQLVGLRLAFDILDTDPEIVDRPSARFLARAEGSIAFEGVGFSYSQRMNTLVDVDFEAPAGQVTAVVGPTGAGKSTLVSLIPRFYDPHQGRVLIDGVDIREIKIKSLRNHISLVLQEPLLFSGTIYDNILYGRLEAGDDDVFAAAEAAGAQEFIQRLPKGYKTVLGERGAQLSGGERQRISIARAFLKDAPVLILDEPTSAIDSKTEGLILDALDRLMVGRTTFLIAHRLSTIRNANRILVLNRGRIVEQGTHEELLGGEGGLYRQLYDAQVKPRLVPGDEPRRRAAGVPE